MDLFPATTQRNQKQGKLIKGIEIQGINMERFDKLLRLAPQQVTINQPDCSQAWYQRFSMSWGSKDLASSMAGSPTGRQ